MATDNRFKRALKAPAKERPVLDLVASGAEAVADVLMKDELFAAVPVFSTAFKAMKALDSTRDRLFAAKLVAFVTEVDAAPSSVREEIAMSLAAEGEGRKAGETLLLVLEKLTDMDKPALLGAVLVHYGYGRLTAAELRRLVTAVDMAFGDDLSQMLNETELELGMNVKAPYRESLVYCGLMSSSAVATIGATFIEFRVTGLGRKLWELVNKSPEHPEGA